MNEKNIYVPTEGELENLLECRNIINKLCELFKCKREELNERVNQLLGRINSIKKELEVSSTEDNVSK
ncbi:MAG: hypothetical protein ACTSRU_15890 [Candidatus Hodarchaeales archaeon]